jgi:hypothetical protein
VPFAFVTGYSKDVLPPPYRDRPLLQKPFRTQAVLATLAMIIALPRHQKHRPGAHRPPAGEGACGFPEVLREVQLQWRGLHHHFALYENDPEP